MPELLNSLAVNWWEWMRLTVVQVTALIGVAYVLDMAVRRWAWPQLRFALWLLVFAKLVMPPTLSSPVSLTAPLLETGGASLRLEPQAPQPMPLELPAPQTEFATPTAKRPPASAVESAAVETASAPAMENGQDATLSWKVWLLTAWLTGAAGLLLAAFLRWRKLRRSIQRSIHPVSVEHRKAFEEAAALLGIKRPPRLAMTDAVAVPGVFGTLRPTVLIPFRAARSLSSMQLRHIFLHELAHIQRRDPLIQQATLLLYICYWFHPLLPLIRRRIQHLQELCCDAKAAAALGDAAPAYRSTLLAMSKRLLEGADRRPFLQPGLMESRCRLLDRLRWLEKRWWRRPKLRRATVAAASLILLATVLPMSPGQATSDEGFALVQLSTFTPAGPGDAYIDRVNLRFQRTDGGWALFEASYGSDRSEVWFRRLGSGAGPPLTHCDDWRRHPDFIREDVVLGYRVFVVSQRVSNQSHQETSFAPDLRCWPIRLVIASQEGVWSLEPIEIRRGTPADNVFQSEPDVDLILGRSLTERTALDTAAFPEVFQMARQALERAADLALLSEFENRALRRVKAMAVMSPEGESPSVRPFHYSFWPSLPGRFGLDGSIFLASMGTSEIHRVSPTTGEIEANYFLGTQAEFRGARSFTVDDEGTVHALLPDDSAGWTIRRFYAADSFEDVTLSLPGGETMNADALEVDRARFYYVLEIRPQLAVHKFSRDGFWLEAIRVDPRSLYAGSSLQPEDSDVFVGSATGSLTFGSPMAVLPDGRIYVLLRYLSRNVTGIEYKIPAVLCEIDPASKTATPLALPPPSSSSRLTAMFPGPYEIALEWTDEEEVGGRDRTSLRIPSFPSHHFHFPRRIMSFDGFTQKPLATVRGEILAVSQTQMVVRTGSPLEDGPVLYLVSASSAQLSGGV